MSAPTIDVSVRLPKELHARLVQQARRERLTPVAYIKRVVKTDVQRSSPAPVERSARERSF